MAKVLRQRQIDAIFSQVSKGKIAATKSRSGAVSEQKQVRVYDWKHPDRFSKDQLWILENLHDNFIRYLEATISSYFREIVDVELISVTQMAYSEFIASLPNPSCSISFLINPLGGLAIIDISYSIVFRFVDRLFGGKGNHVEPERGLTNIEKRLMRQVTGRILNDLETAWARTAELKMRIRDLETNPQFMQIVLPNEVVIVICLAVKSESVSGLINLCYPYITLEPVVPQLNPQHWVTSTQAEDDDKVEKQQISLEELLLPVSARFPTTDVTIRDLIKMQVGDVLRLDTKITDNILIFVEDVPKFLAQPGQRGRKLAVKITSRITRKGGEDTSEGEKKGRS